MAQILPNHRAALKLALQAHGEAQSRLTELEEAQARAFSERIETAAARDAAASHVAALQRNRPKELVADYLRRPGPEVTPLQRQELVEAEANVTRCKAHYAHLLDVDTALEHAIAEAQSVLRRRANDLHMALANVVVTSESFKALCREMDATWTRLRTLHAVTDLLIKTTRANIPPDALRRLQASQPLDVRNEFPCDEAAVAVWQEALDRLLVDADSNLPEV